VSDVIVSPRPALLQALCEANRRAGEIECGAKAVFEKAL